ncbi:hypothetical protein [Agrobacterium sp. CG674]
MIDSMLMGLAIINGTVKFEERRDDVRVYANVLGMKVTLAAITKKELAQMLAQTADGTIATGQPVDMSVMKPRPPVTPPAPPTQPRRGFKLELVK